jgi:peptidoglycan/xylan/chitin deacetylase (PgdA/CDA1 family)
MSRLTRPLLSVATACLSSTRVRRIALGTAVARRRSLVLLYHRIAPSGPGRSPVVPSLPEGLLRQQLAALGEIGELLPLPTMLQWSEPRRQVGFAITFDDDHPAHVEYALPVLRAMGVPATFFLSGRALHGLGPYWWELLEWHIATKGLERTRAQLDLRGRTPAELAAECEGNARSRHLLETMPADSLPRLDHGAIRTLAQADMSIGFHTLRHPVLTMVPERDLHHELLDGCRELASAVGREVNLLAYPHGKADSRIARTARAAGYHAAFRTGGRPIARNADPFLLGRWEPGALDADEFVAQVALRLNLPVGAPGG